MELGIVLHLSVNMVVSTINLPLKKNFSCLYVCSGGKKKLISLDIMLWKELPLHYLFMVNYSSNSESKNFYLLKIKLSWNHSCFPVSLYPPAFTLSPKNKIQTSCQHTVYWLASAQRTRGGQRDYVRSEALQFIKLFNISTNFYYYVISQCFPKWTVDKSRNAYRLPGHIHRDFTAK